MVCMLASCSPCHKTTVRYLMRGKEGQGQRCQLQHADKRICCIVVCSLQPSQAGCLICEGAVSESFLHCVPENRIVLLQAWRRQQCLACCLACKLLRCTRLRVLSVSSGSETSHSLTRSWTHCCQEVTRCVARGEVGWGMYFVPLGHGLIKVQRAGAPQVSCCALLGFYFVCRRGQEHGRVHIVAGPAARPCCSLHVHATQRTALLCLC